MSKVFFKRDTIISFKKREKILTLLYMHFNKKRRWHKQAQTVCGKAQIKKKIKDKACNCFNFVYKIADRLLQISK